ncbi:MAG: hypothetical protein AMXMBFR64_55130 [Myxococcales bacterium]
MRASILWTVVAGIAALALPALAADPKVGDTVWAQWRPNSWYHGKADKACDRGLHIAFDDGDEACISPALAAVDAAPSAGGVRAGTRVLARWTDGKLYPATALSAGGDRVRVRYDDRAELEVAVSDTRLLADEPQGRGVAVGDVVWAQWKPNAWYHGKLTKSCDLGFHVAFDDGDEACTSPALIAKDSAPGGPPRVGARVIAKWRDGKLYPGTVSGVSGTTISIAYDDGDQGTAALSDIRVYSR